MVAVCGHMFHKQCILKILQRSMNQYEFRKSLPVLIGSSVEIIYIQLMCLRCLRCPLGCAQRIEERSLRRVYGVGPHKTLPGSRKSSASGGNPAAGEANMEVPSSPSPSQNFNFMLNQPM